VVKIGAPIVCASSWVGRHDEAPECRLDLTEALRVAGVENPTIGLALETVRSSEAELLGARALLLPTLNAGVTLDLHAGNLEASSGIIRDLRRGSLYAGAGAGVRAAETVPIPGVRVFAHLADALFEPRAAREQVAGRRADADATRNNILLEVAIRYLALAGAEARLQALRVSEQDLEVVVRMLATGTQAGQWRQGDADRSAAEALLLRTEEQQAEGEVAVASAELARLLSLDPSTRLRVAEEVVPVIQLVDPTLTLEQLLQVARNRRPEVAARTADVARAEIRLREERVRPLVPLLSVGFSAGDFGGGSDQIRPHFANYGRRTDFDVFAVWSLQNLGLGNLSLQRARRAEVGQAEARLMAVLNQVNREVAEAFALSAARERDREVARRRVQESGASFRQDLLRARNLAGKPIELLNSLTLLAAARQDLVRAVTEYSQAQVRLFVALGQPPLGTPHIH
jgi:outer membrane protein TolC